MIDSKGYAHGLMLLTMVLVASSFPVGHAITKALPPEILMFLRFSLAVMLFAPYVFIKNGFGVPPWKRMRYYIVLSMPLVVFFWSMFESLRYTSAVNTGALFTIIPALTAIYARFINREITTKVRSLGLLLGTLGALWIVFRGDYDALLGLKLNYGDFIFILGCLFFGLYNPLVRRFYRGEPMEVMTFWVLVSGAGWLLLISGTSILTIDWWEIERKVYAGVLYLSLFTTLVTFFLVQFCVVRLGPTKVAAYNFLTPVFVLIMSISLGMDKFEPVILPGVLFVIGAMIVIQRETDKERNNTKSKK